VTGVPVESTPRRDVLWCFVGEWRVTGEWERVPGKPTVPVEGEARTSWLFERTAIELDQHSPDGAHVARTLLAYDRSRRDFVAFTASALALHYEVERGHYDEGRHQLVLRGEELVAPGSRPVAFARTITFDVDGGFDTSITYPGPPPGMYGEMHLRYRRRGR